jgi:hypothetical protein
MGKMTKPSHQPTSTYNIGARQRAFNVVQLSVKSKMCCHGFLFCWITFFSPIRYITHPIAHATTTKGKANNKAPLFLLDMFSSSQTLQSNLEIRLFEKGI